MKPPPFEYRRAGNFDEACELLSGAGDGAKILAGGQSLIPMMNFRLARPRLLIDISTIAERNQVLEEGAGIRIRATTVQRFVERSVAVQERLPLLHNAIQHVAHVQIRNRGTIGGSIVNADPASELPAMCLAFDAQLEIKGPKGARQLPADQFFVTYMTTSLAQDEILTSILFPAPSKNSGWGFHEVARRAGDFALVGSAALVSLDERGKCQRARLVLFGAAPTPVRAVQAEQMLLGQNHSTSLLREAAQRVQEVLDPESDMHVRAEYRRSVAEVLAARALEDSFRRAAQQH
jgi:aerobic carbon-monoxide dehydrogenase medium subunit